MNIIVSGASRGIGAALIKKLDALGHKTLAISRSRNALEELKKKGKLITIIAADINQSDFSDQILPVLEQWQKVDVIINNAGQLLNKPFIRTTTDDFLTLFQANVLTAINLIQACTPFLVKGSHIVNISSMGGVNKSLKFPGLSAYSTSKGALTVLTECLAEEYKEIGAHVNALALGSVHTEMFKLAFPNFEAAAGVEEMANYIADFALNGSALFNGKIIPVAVTNP